MNNPFDLPEPAHPKPARCVPQDYAHNREYFYDVPTQLDLLWHDIDQGRFGSAAQQGGFYQYILNIKTRIPKPPVE
jgi:hypothetical protein